MRRGEERIVGWDGCSDESEHDTHLSEVTIPISTVRFPLKPGKSGIEKSGVGKCTAV